MTDIGARYDRKNNCGSFRVWAPLRNRVVVKIVRPEERIIPMGMDKRGYWHVEANGIVPGTKYLYRLDNERDRPDPASRFQPDGVHGPSQVIDLDAFKWEDSLWNGLSLKDFIIYELHVGTFTTEGTFDAVAARLDYLGELGVTAVELMPVAQFPGVRNWGYDGVYPYAVQNSYGGPDGLKRLVNACHLRGIAVILDVVYNHLGPEGNYLADFGPYFTDNYRTPWGQAINFDGSYSDEVRCYFIENALYWVREYHIDALRIDAIHGIFDFSAKHFLQELAEIVHREAAVLDRKIYVIAESDLNDVRVISPEEIGGYGIDALWNDDFHHAVHTLLTGEQAGYYQDFGKIEQLKKAFKEGFIYSGEYSSFRKRRHGSSSRDMFARQFVVFSQNHDQIGNRMNGERLTSLVPFEALKLVAGTVLLSPNIPLLFMGEEYGETAPFQYFVSHNDAFLIEAVRKGRLGEFACLQCEGAVPDPQAEETFLRSKIDSELHQAGKHKMLFNFYAQILKLRKSLPALSIPCGRDATEVKGFENERVFTMHRRSGESNLLILLAFHRKPVSLPILIPEGTWVTRLDSSSPKWGGPGERAVRKIVSYGEEIALNLNAFNIVLYERDREEL
ncbi:MAG: malto-oligosyltrehalose trehalohydrolase [Nitrospirota bacterium]